MIEVHFTHMFGIYIHFPYCRKRCPFCDFAVAVKPRIPHQEYERAVLSELDARAALYPGRRAVSIYFGGGTPGLWRADCVGRVIGALVSRFGAPEEVTVECIPGELSAEHAAALRAAGVTRLSIGIESLDDAQLCALGRQHSAAQAREAIGHARAAGFASLSADLMFALPGQSVAAFLAELAAACALELEHLSLYQLTIEPGTQFARLGMRTSEGADHFMAAHDHMRAAGYLHYEISSYARPGREAVHNSLYWRGGEYLGLGMSAHSFRRLPDGGGERFANSRQLDAYLCAPAGPPALRETLAAPALRREAIWLWLRRLDPGIPRSAFAERYGADPVIEHAGTVGELERAGLLEVSPSFLRLTDRGMLLADTVATHFL